MQIELLQWICNKNKTREKESFIKYVRSVSNDVVSKQNNGLTALVDENKLNPQIRESLKDGKKEGDIVKVNLKDVGTQIIYVERYIPEKRQLLKNQRGFNKSCKKKSISKRDRFFIKIDDI